MLLLFIELPISALCNSGPMWIQSALEPLGFTEAQCWLAAAVCGAVLVAVSTVIIVRSCKGREAAFATKEDLTDTMSLKGFLKTVLDALKLKQYRTLLIAGLFFLITFTLCDSVIVYALINNARMDENQIGVFWVLFAVFTAVGAPIALLLAGRTNKKTTYIIFMVMLAAALIAYWFIGMSSPVYAYIFGALFAVGQAGFWTMYCSMVVDNIQLFEFVYGKKREGIIVSVSDLMLTCGSGIATLLAGISLELVGYRGGAEVTESVSRGILGTVTLLPAAMLVVVIIALAGYRLNRKEFGALKEALELKKQGKEYSTALFDKAL
jgi:GPH family glycoside/pentoside/hexuronide:cation symporter